MFGVADGTRTHDDRNHNPGLYQLSYSHRRALNYRVKFALILKSCCFSLNTWALYLDLHLETLFEQLVVGYAFGSS